MDSAIYRHVGHQIRIQRKSLGWTQAKLASRCSVSRATIANLESGEQRVSLDTLFAICHPLGVEPSSVLPSVFDEVAPVELDDEESDVYRELMALGGLK